MLSGHSESSFERHGFCDRCSNRDVFIFVQWTDNPLRVYLFYFYLINDIFFFILSVQDLVPHSQNLMDLCFSFFRSSFLLSRTVGVEWIIIRFLFPSICCNSSTRNWFECFCSMVKLFLVGVWSTGLRVFLFNG